MPPIIKATGGTPTERLLAGLCERSFLKLWSYPSPIKDDHKELCDLLAVFGKHVLIFFDRENRTLGEAEENPALAWARWKRKVIDAQIRTVHGAERYLKSGRPVFLDSALKVPLPVQIDPTGMIVHKIIVAHGAAEACAKSSDANVYGSLAVMYGRAGHQPASPWPFFVELDKDDPVHVLDSHNLPILLGELDTFFDFSRYLDAKVEAIKRLDSLLYCGEEDLLAHYWCNYDPSTNRYSIGPKSTRYNWVAIGEGEWKDFIWSRQYGARKLADKDSYLWDELIQRTAENALNGTLMGDGDHSRGNSAICEMAMEPRFARRALSAQMMKAIREFPEVEGRIVRHMSFMPSYYPDKGYVFLQLKVDGIADYDNDYRPKRRALLEIACGAAKNKMENLKTVVGIAIDAPKFAGRKNSEDFLLMRCEDWSDDLRKRYEVANEGFNFFATDKLVITERKVTEFPVPDEKQGRVSYQKRVGRNDPCPCGSGKKYKRCCLLAA